MGTLGKRLLATGALAAVALGAAACGSQQISVPRSRPRLYEGAVLFNQRCSGCHTLSYAAARGSAVNVRTAQYNNGPNFDIRCERPITRVLYAIANGGFSGAVMPQNVVVGQQARDVALFVATYAGRGAPKVPGVRTCQNKAIGAIPVFAHAAAAASTSSTTPATTTATASAPAAAKKKHKP